MKHNTCVVALLCTVTSGCAGFAPKKILVPSRSNHPKYLPSSTTSPIPHAQTTTPAQMSLASMPAIARNVASNVSVPTSLLKAMFTALALLVVTQRARIFYPGSLPDPSHVEPLPPGTIGGCPWFGSLSMFANTNQFIIDRASKLGGTKPAPKIWKMFGLGR